MSSLVEGEAKPTPEALILYHLSEEGLMNNFLDQLRFLQLDGFVKFTQFHISNNRFGGDIRDEFEQTIKDASLIIILCTQHLVSMSNFENLVGIIFKRIDIDTRSIIPIISNTLLGDAEEKFFKIFDDVSANIRPIDHSAAFQRRTTDQFEAVLAEITETVIDELEAKYYNPVRISVRKRDRVFISYAKKDFQLAQQLRAYLTRRGVATWIDQYNLIGGQNWMDRIDSALRESWALILVLTENAKKSEYVNYEWSYAFGAQCCVIPIMYQAIKPHPRLIPINCLTWFYHPSDQYPWYELIDALEFSRTAFAKNTCNQ